MKFKLAVFLIFVFFLSAQSQDKRTRWMAGLAASGVLYQDIKAADGFAHKYSDRVYGLRSGIEASRKFGRRSALQLGFYFSVFKYNVDYHWTGILASDPAVPARTSVDASHTEISMLHNFHFISGKSFSIYSCIGGSALLGDNLLKVLRLTKTGKHGALNIQPPSFPHCSSALVFNSAIKVRQ